MDKQPSREELMQRVASLEARLQIYRKQKRADSCVETFGHADMMQAADGICVCHAIDEFPFVRFTFWNRQMIRLTGYDMQTINRQGWYQSVYPDPDVQARAIERMTQMREGVNLEAENWEITRADGETSTLRISTSVLDREDGIPRVMAIMHDVTELKRFEAELRSDKQHLKRQIVRQSELLADAQQALKVSDARYYALFKIAGDALLIANDRDEILDANQTVSDLLGYSRNELLTMKICDLQAHECRDGSGRVLLNEFADHQGKPFETLDQHKDGTVIPVEVSNTRLKDAGLFISIVRDIRERKLAEKALKESEDKLSKAFYPSPNAIIISRLADGMILDVNEAFIRTTGYDRDDIIGRTTFDINLWADPRDRHKYVARLRTDGHVGDFDFRFKAKSGEIRYGLLASVLIELDAGACVLGTIQDITEQRRAEAATLHEKHFSEMVISHLPGSFYMFPENGRMIRWNDNLEKITGYSRDEISRMNAIDFFAVDEKEKVHRRIQEVFISGTSQVEASFLTKDGRRIPHLLTGVRVEYAGETYLVGVGLDMTDEIEIKLALKESEERFRQIAENIKEVFWLFDWSAQRVLYVSPAFDQIWGRSREDLYARYDEWSESIHPEDLNHARQTFDRILETGGGEPREYRIVRPDGAERWISDIGYAIRDENNKVVRIAGIVEDITERKQTQEALARERERLAVTLRSIGDAVITTDRDGRIVLMNRIAETLTGWNEADALGRNLMEVFRIVDKRTGTACANPVDKVLDSGKIVALANHTVLVARNGQEFAIADSGAPIRNARNDIIGVVLVFRDITGQERIEKELMKMEKLKSLGVLAGGIAHDFNNFLTGIIGNLSLAKLDVQPGHPLVRPLDEMEKAALRAKELTQQLLTFSKGGEPVKHITRIDELIRECAQFVLHGSNVRCEMDIDPDLHSVDVDAGQIAQVLNNLMINADQAMPDGGTALVRAVNVALASGNPYALEPGDYVQLTVKDEGLGIQPAHLKKVFDPYFTTKQKGSGLGLAVAYSIILKHSGQLSVESKLGEGSQFTILLPGATDFEVTTQDGQHGLIAGKGRILVMDDEDFVRDLAAAMLGKMGYEVVLAEDGHAAVAIFDRAMDAGQPFDAVILDLTIPGGMGGQETLIELMKLDPDVKAIVSSGYSNDPVMANHAAHGFKDAVKKPYLVQEMSRVLHDVINGQ